MDLAAHVNKPVSVRLILVAFAMSGAAALIYEVAWTRSLSLVMGSTTYAISTMLANFMAGLALGGWLGGKVADRWPERLRTTFGAIEVGIGFFGLITVPLINSISPWYFGLYKRFHLMPEMYFVFQFLLSSSVMLIPTTLMGMSFPVVGRIVTRDMQSLGRSIGGAYSANTVGAILGSLAAGFMLIPLFGIKVAVFTAALLNGAVGILMLAVHRKRRHAVALVALLAFMAGSAAIASQEDDWAISFYSAGRYDDYRQILAESQSVLLFNKDYREGRVKLWRSHDGFLIVQVGGKIEGTAREDMGNVLSLAYLPVAAHPSAMSALNIGLGAGVTLSALKHAVPDVTLVEINEGVIEGVRQYGEVGLLNGVDVVINDARNYLSTIERRFDIITSEPSYPSDFPTGNLFTREFYSLAKEHLNEGGVYCQWLPYYLMNDYDVEVMLNTVHAEFGNLYLWKVDSTELLLLASDKPFAFGEAEIRRRFDSLNVLHWPVNIVVSRTPAQIDEIVSLKRETPLNTDDHPILEYDIVRAILRGRGV